MDQIDFYELLDVAPDADEATIRAAIRRVRSRYRQLTGSPDKAQARKAEEMIETLSLADRTLLDEEARAAFDDQLRQADARAAEEAARREELNRQAEEDAARARQDAARAAERAVAQRADGWVDEAQSYFDRADPINAMKAAMEATRVDEANLRAWELRARSALKIRDHREADFSASQALKRAPGEPFYHGLMGLVRLEQGRNVDAEAAFTTASRLDPDHPQWHDQATWAIARQNRVGDALASAEATYQRFPHDPAIGRTLSLLLMKDVDQAMSYSGGRLFITSKTQIDIAEDRLRKVASIGSTDPTVQRQREALTDLVTKAKRRSFTPKPVWIIVLIFYLLFGWAAVSNATSGFFGLLVGALLAFLAFTAMFPVGWRKSRKQLGPGAQIGVQ